MTAPRRRLVRPAPAPTAPPLQRQRQVQRWRARLEVERAALARWQKRLRRAFNAVEKHGRNIARLERQIARQEE